MNLDLLKYDTIIDKMLLDVFKIYQLINDSVEILKHSMFTELIYFITFYYLLHKGEMYILVNMIKTLKKNEENESSKLKPKEGKYNIMYFYFNNIFISTIMFGKCEVSYVDKIINDFFLSYHEENNIKKFISLLFAPIFNEDLCYDTFNDVFLKEFIVYSKFTYENLLTLYLEKIKDHVDNYRYELLISSI